MPGRKIEVPADKVKCPFTGKMVTRVVKEKPRTVGAGEAFDKMMDLRVAYHSLEPAQKHGIEGQRLITSFKFYQHSYCMEVGVNVPNIYIPPEPGPPD